MVPPHVHPQTFGSGLCSPVPFSATPSLHTQPGRLCPSSHVTHGIYPSSLPEYLLPEGRNSTLLGLSSQCCCVSSSLNDVACRHLVSLAFGRQGQLQTIKKV